ncbi:glycosyltransferase family 2 protein [Francisella sp. XLW-1]|uniref:glycosyltransferase family 2 protein n=1 Tax=Francisella sp. XLW-1 TaxID=2610887 RepID=UPI00123DDA9F|nr:glycosyltransferase family 2 protein [Francisella sp. XLW-1]
MESEKRFLSLIMVYDQNKYHLLKKSLQSVCEQSASDRVSVLIVDTSGDLDLNDKLFTDLLSLEFNSMKKLAFSYYDALNAGVSIISTEWVCFLQLGDVYASKNVIEEAISIVKDNTADVYYGNSLRLTNTVLGTCRTEIAESVETIAKKQPFLLESCIFKSNILKAYMFNTFYEYAAEYDLLIRLFKGEVSFFYLPLVISESSDSKSFNERFERLFIISKYFGDDLVKSSYFKPYIRLREDENSKLIPLNESIRSLENLIEKQKSVLNARQSEFNQIKTTMIYKLAKRIDNMLSIVFRSHK